MAVISIRLNTEEEQMVNFLSTYYDEEKSTLIKHSLKEMYEDIVDRGIIEHYESKERSGEAHFLTGEEIIKSL